MSSSREETKYLKWCTTSFDTTKLPASINSTSRNNSVIGRDVLKYSYNLGIFSPGIEKMSNDECDKEDSKEIGPSKAMKVPRDLEDEFSSSYFHTVPTKKNSFAITSYLRKPLVSPSTTIRKSRAVPSANWEPAKQDFTEINFIPPTSETRQITCSEIKEALTNSENEGKSQIRIDENSLTKSILFVPFEEYTTINSDNIVKEEQNNVLQVPLSPKTKFRRAARRLGVLIPAEELHNKQRRNGVCEEMDEDADQRKLLRVLNKRF